MLYSTLCNQGDWAFRWRSIAPAVLMIPAVIVALMDVQYFLDSHTYDQWWDLFAISFVVAGLGIRVWTTGHTPRRTSGRNTKGQVADSLNTRGIYSIVRNPLYLGNFVGGLGVILLLHSLWLTLYYVLAFALYFERVILVEERFLLRKFGDSYRQWAEKTPAFFPLILRKYQPDELPFCLRTVLRREYITVAMTVLLLFVMEVGEDTMIQGEIILDSRWLIIAAINGGMFLFFRVVSKRTRWLSRVGR